MTVHAAYSGPSGVRPRITGNRDFLPMEDRWRIGFPEWDRYDKGYPLVDDYPYQLGRWFEAALSRHQAPLVSGRRLKLRYITQAKARPPTFVAFGTRAEMMPEDYQRYLVNSLRDSFHLPGTPIRLQLRGTKNPFAES